MTRHPNMNRSNRSLGQNPTPAEVQAAREFSGMTTTQCAETIFRTVRTWQAWESGERRMPQDSFCLFLLITGQATLEQVIAASDKARGAETISGAGSRQGFG